jgi:hypothetical protein
LRKTLGAMNENNNDGNEDNTTANKRASDDLVAFFRALPAEARREYEALAELDRRFGEDVQAEQTEQGSKQ